ncbi:hypothetical protein F4703DRAFT_1789003 [Phycomyces blakesleeanus]
MKLSKDVRAVHVAFSLPLNPPVCELLTTSENHIIPPSLEYSLIQILTIALLVKKRKIPTRNKDIPLSIYVDDGRELDGGAITRETLSVKLFVGKHFELTSFHVLSISTYPIILGTNWRARDDGFLLYDKSEASTTLFIGDNIHCTGCTHAHLPGITIFGRSGVYGYVTYRHRPCEDCSDHIDYLICLLVTRGFWSNEPS